MNSNTPKLRAVAVRELRLVEPGELNVSRATAALSQLKNSVHADLLKQTDLLHIEAVLVSEGINDNDDAFTHEELKRAVSSPILKPMNWQHKDDQILGAMYAVEARDFNGNILEEIGDQPVELVVQGVVWHHLPHIKATAKQIVDRVKSGELFVSMECWFDNYDYGLYSSANELYDVISRNEETAHLEGYLRCNGGVGQYNGMRIGRALSGINFGGVAFVDRPANKRSFILNQFSFDPSEIVSHAGADEDGLPQDQVVTNNVVSDVNPPMEVTMNDLNRTAASRDEIQQAVERALEAEKKAEAAQRIEGELGSTRAHAAKLEGELETTKKSLAKLHDAIDRAFESAKAGATGSTPEEIAKIDRGIESDSADGVFSAKIAWIESSRASAAEALASAKASDSNEAIVEQNLSLKRELAELKGEIRKAEIEYLFRDVLEMEPEEVQVFVKAGLAFDNDAGYSSWMEEKKLFAKKMMEMKKKGYDKKMMKEDEAEAGLLSPTSREMPIDPKGAVLRTMHGTVPSDVARSPRSKISASATEIENMFEEVTEPNLAGASAEVEAGESPMGKLVAGLLKKPIKENQKN